MCLLILLGGLIILLLVLFVKSAHILLPWTISATVLAGLVASNMVSCKRQGKRFLDLARSLWQNSDPQAIDLEALQGG